jgi:hypothetical protein
MPQSTAFPEVSFKSGDFQAYFSPKATMCKCTFLQSHSARIFASLVGLRGD